MTGMTTGEQAPFIRIEGITKKFGEFVAVDNVSIDIEKGEFFALLGGSGCGKTTLLRMLAGFEVPSAGRIYIDGQDMTSVAPYDRPVNMMFQSYALFPHMTVEKNIGYGLKHEKISERERQDRVRAMLDLVQLTPFAGRKPHQISGGQRQRVALARALVKQPKLLLLDEPLGALDKKLREHTQFELANIQYKLGITFVVVTHDQEEAMTVSSRIAVMDHGELVQVSTPGEIYETPQSQYVASFIGDVNILECRVTNVQPDGQLELSWVDGTGKFVAQPPPAGASKDQQVWLAIRPEKVRIALEKPASDINAIPGKVDNIGYLGSISHYHVAVGNDERVTALRANAAHTVDNTINWENDVWLDWPVDAGVVLCR